MQLDLIKSLQTRFSLSSEQIENLKALSVQQLIAKQKAAKIPKLIIIGGQEGSFKHELQKIALKEVSNNALVLSKDGLRKFHPNYIEIQAQYPDMVRVFTDDLAKTLLSNLESEAIERKLNVILNASLGDAEKIAEKINLFKTNQFEISLNILSLQKMFSFLNCEQTYEQILAEGKSAINLSKQHHDKNFEAIELTLQKLKRKDLLDYAHIYQVKIQENEGIFESKIVPLTKDKNKFVEAYFQERNRDFTDMELTYLKAKAQSILNMKTKREANFLEKVRFDANFKLILEGKGMNGLRKEKVVKMEG